MQIIFGILVTAIGGSLVIQTEWFVTNFGRINWFEEKLGSDGGSRLGYKLIGILLLFIGVILMTGSGDAFFGWLLTPLIHSSNPMQ